MVCNCTGLLNLESHRKVLERHMNMMANGIVEIIPNQTFQVWVSKLSNHVAKLFKNAIVGLPSPARGSISTLTAQIWSGELHSKERGAQPISKEEKSTTWINAETATSPNRSTNWKEDVTVGYEGQPCKERIRYLLDLYSSLMCGQLVLIRATQNSIDLIHGAKPIHWQPYQAVPKAREVKIEEVERMLQEGLIEPHMRSGPSQ